MYPVPFYGQDYEKQSLELVTRLFELRNMFTKIGPFESGNWKEKEEEEKKNIEYLKNEKCLLEKIKTIFHNF